MFAHWCNMIKGKDDILVVFALEQESQNVFDDYPVLYTGVGKVQAALALSQHLQRATPKMIVNLGTAGSQKHTKGSVVNATSFIQRDMDVTPLGLAPYQTPFSAHPVELVYGEAVHPFPTATCGTGDNFSVQEDFGNGAYDVVDMEAYVLALISKSHGIPFVCLKYISDGADGAADLDWEEALKVTASTLKTALEQTFKSVWALSA